MRNYKVLNNLLGVGANKFYIKNISSPKDKKNLHDVGQGVVGTNIT